MVTATPPVVKIGTADFVEKPQPPFFARLVRTEIAQTSAEFLEKYPKSGEWQYNYVLFPLSFRNTKNDEGIITDSAAITDNINSKMAARSAAMNEAIKEHFGVDLQTAESDALEAFFGTAFEFQRRTKKLGNLSFQYLHTVRVVPDAEAAAITPESSTSEAAPSGPVVSAADVEDTLISLIGPGATFAELRDRVGNDDTLKANKELVGAIINGRGGKGIFAKLVKDGRLAVDGDTFKAV